ncbi:MAG: hypothetical protein GY898_33165 [Proteobacteria bacterium]|nr:hypothetical protein [Pseudomonadota bacterium]
MRWFALPLLLMTLVGCPSTPDDVAPIVAVTWNTGTTEGLNHDAGPDDGYTSEHAATSDEYYGDGLAWLPAVEAATDWLAETEPDIVVFQEIFWSGECGDIPVEHHADFYCEGLATDAPTVASAILGDGWQVACHPGKPDKCAAVREAFGRFAGCDGGFCLEGLDGFGVEGCGNGARVARGLIERTEGELITLVNVHGSSGIATDDEECRRQQVEQVFVDLGDGAPAADGALNLVMGDFNTDPGRWTGSDVSAARWTDFVGPDHDFHFVTDVGPDATPTYSGIVNIDHVVSDRLEGACTHPTVIDAVYFDHVPALCTLELSPAE